MEVFKYLYVYYDFVTYDKWKKSINYMMVYCE